MREDKETDRIHLQDKFRLTCLCAMQQRDANEVPRRPRFVHWDFLLREARVLREDIRQLRWNGWGDKQFLAGECVGGWLQMGAGREGRGFGEDGEEGCGDADADAGLEGEEEMQWIREMAEWREAEGDVDWGLLAEVMDEMGAAAAMAEEEDDDDDDDEDHAGCSRVGARGPNKTF